MPKKLESGLVVSSADYYALLEWKDNNLSTFITFCDTHGEKHYSLNRMSEQNFNTLVVRYIDKRQEFNKDKFTSFDGTNEHFVEL